MEKALQILNQLEAEGLITRYAIGGATAVLFYSEPLLTYDVDVFVFLPPPQGKIITLEPLYHFLKSKGYKVKGEHVVVEGVPIQFIPAYNALVAEAVESASEVRYKKERVRVLSLEHLLAVMAQTGRPKDRARLAQILNRVPFDKKVLRLILKRHDLEQQWQKVVRQLKV